LDVSPLFDTPLEQPRFEAVLERLGFGVKIAAHG
jgi:hypothetical protein